MKTTTPTNILDLLDQGVSSPTKIASKLGISTQATHRHLKQLINAGFVKKEGGAPRTTYIINCEQPHSRIENDYIYAKETILPIFLKKFNKLKIDKDSRNNPSHDFMIKSSAVFSSKIEGISLDLNSFMQDKRLLDRHTKKEITEVEDLVESYAYAERHRLNQNNFLKSHQLLSKHIVSPTRRGSYRREPIGVFSKEGLVYLAIEDISCLFFLYSFYPYQIQMLKKLDILILQNFFKKCQKLRK